jgi:hypothetical protein
MIETPHVFGSYDHLFGIHCHAQKRLTNDLAGMRLNRDEPKSTVDPMIDPTVDPSKTAVLMLTAGMLSSVGPSRLHVELADSLSNRGISSFRFDLSGIGESLAVGSPGSSQKRAAREVQQAMNLLEAEYGYQRFMLFGLCSGADDAIVAAIEDKRIVGASLLDGCGYPTPWHPIGLLLQKYGPKLLSLRKWADYLNHLLRKPTSVSSTMPQGLDIREFPAQEQSAREIETLIGRGVKLQFIYTSGVIDYYSYENQFYDMFPSLKDRKEISVSYHPKWDHTVMLREDRADLVELVTQWFVNTTEPASNHVKNLSSPISHHASHDLVVQSA